MRSRVTLKAGLYNTLVVLILAFAAGSGTVYAQELHDFSFQRDTIIACQDINETLLSFGFAGGMNSCQYGNIDLNNDQVKDLVVFDRHGNRILPFLRKSSGINGYTYSPGYAKYFPEMNNWMQLIDYNHDGREDIFTYTTGGIKVFRNISDGVPEFVQVSHPYLRSLQGPSFTNILVTYADYPAISDIDGDGDLDIMTFWGLGSFVELHQNMSVEKYGSYDSLEFVRTETCWGRFAEGEDSDLITLDTCKGVKSEQMKPIDSTGDGDPKHTGSTLLTLDLDGDLDKDLILGDVDYPTLKTLWNGGDTSYALITSVDQSFPVGSQSVDMVSFPASCLVDVNNDGINDVIVSPFDPSLIRGESKQSSWLYLNSGSAASPVFNLAEKDFLQKEMLDFGSGAYPVATDVDDDGITDLLVGNYGYLDSSYYENGHILHCIYKSRLAWIRNTGTSGNPSFRLMTDDYANLSNYKILSAFPATADMDGDGDDDLLVGNADGSFIFFENIAGKGFLPEYAKPVFHYQSLDAGDFSAPQLVDLDQDGLVDLVSGKRDGKLCFYKNTGSSGNPVFSLITDFLGHVDVTDPELSYYGYSTPCFFKSSDEKWSLFVGSESRGVFCYNNITGNLGGIFTLEESPLKDIREGWRTGPTVFNSNADSYPDMVVGNYAGGLAFYRGIQPQPIGIIESKPAVECQVSLYPNPASDKIHINVDKTEYSGLVKIEIFSIDGSLCYTSGYISIKSEMIVPLKELCNGIYFCKIDMNAENSQRNHIIYRRFVITR